MGTNNFLNKNASNIFACKLEDDFSYDFLKENLIEDLKEKFGNQFIAGEEYDNERNFSGVYLGQIDYDYRDCCLRLKPVIRSGYYEGVNLDYEIEFISEQDYCESLNDLKLDLEYLGRPTKAVEKSFTKQQKIMIKKLEKVFANNSTPLNKVGGFSDGTAIYEKA